MKTNKKTFLDFETVGDKVLFLLEEFPLTRENDNQLIATFILNEIGFSTIGDMTALDLLAKIANSKLPPFATMIRVRQDIQKNKEDLRGTVFGKRKKTVKVPTFVVNIRDK